MCTLRGDMIVNEEGFIVFKEPLPEEDNLNYPQAIGWPKTKPMFEELIETV